MPNAEGVTLAFVLGVIAGVVIGAMRWRSALEEERRRNEFLVREVAMETEITRCWQNQVLYVEALGGDAALAEAALGDLGARGGVLTKINCDAWASAMARDNAVALYHEARRRLAGREPAP